MTTKQHAPASNADPSRLYSFEEWLRGRNLTRTTGYRYRQRGLLKAINIFGRLYITREEIESFERRAIGGEFRKEPKILNRRTVAEVGA